MQPWAIKVITYLSGAWHYRWYGLAAAWVVCLIGWGAVLFIPDQYAVDAKIYVDTGSLMGPLLNKLTVKSDPDQQVNMMLRTLITRPNLEQVIHLVNPKAASLTPRALEDQVRYLESKISITAVPEAKNLFVIGFMDNNSTYAEAVTQSLLSILEDSNIGDKRRDMEGAQTFINGKVSEYEGMLRAAEKRRADFKTANLDLLEKGAANTRLDTANTQVEQAKRDLGTAIARRDSLNEQLQTTPTTVPSDRAAMMANGADGSASDNGGLRGSPLQQLQQANNSLAELRLKYTEDHPDVIAVKKIIQQLQAQIAASPERGTVDTRTPGMPNPVYVQLQSKLSDEQTNVALQTHRVEQATTELAQAKEDTAKAIEVGAKYADLDRDYSIIEQNYQELLKSREAARLSQAVDDQQQTIAFRVIEPPQKSTQPAAPNRLLLNSLVLLAGLGGGLAGAVFLSLNAGRFVVSDELVAEFGVPLIGVVTRLQNAVEYQQTKNSVIAISASLAFLLVCYVGVLVTFQTSIYAYVGA